MRNVWYETYDIVRSVQDATPHHERLTPVSVVVLGFVERRGELTSYELKTRVERSVGYFWPFPHTQLYDEPKRLTALGLLTCREETAGRRRRLYAITTEGRQALDAWLDAPMAAVTRIHDIGLLQLFFTATGSRTSEQVSARARAVANTQIAAHEARLAEYDRIEEQIVSNANDESSVQLDGCVHRTLVAGRQVEQLMISYWRDIAASPPCHG